MSSNDDKIEVFVRLYVTDLIFLESQHKTLIKKDIKNITLSIQDVIKLFDCSSNPYLIIILFESKIKEINLIKHENNVIYNFLSIDTNIPMEYRDGFENEKNSALTIINNKSLTIIDKIKDKKLIQLHNKKYKNKLPCDSIFKLRDYEQNNDDLDKQRIDIENKQIIQRYNISNNQLYADILKELHQINFYPLIKDETDKPIYIIINGVSDLYIITCKSYISLNEKCDN